MSYNYQQRMDKNPAVARTADRPGCRW